MENTRKHRDTKLVSTKGEEIISSEPNYHIIKFFTENLLVIDYFLVMLV